MNKGKGIIKSPKSRVRRLNGKWTTVVLEFIVLFLFWLIFSGRWELRYILTGAFGAGLVTFLTSDLLYSTSTRGKKEGITVSFVFMSVSRLLVYVPWLLLNILKANIHVAALVLNPRMPINPALLQFKTQMRREISLVTLANSITLTPGTITVDLKDNTYLVHALVPETAGDLETGLTQNRVGYVFGETKESPPSVHWAHSFEELK